MERSEVVIAGATGFIGRALGERLAGRFAVRGLTRGAARTAGSLVLRTADLFSLRDAEQALEGARYAVYLVHSMLPSSRLTQGRFEDLDLICADNFARAARRAGIEQIVYLGGILPEAASLSPHLASRLEVEQALGWTGVPVTALRAGLVVGPSGSSLEMMVRLVRRLPVMVTPRWTESLCQPVAQDDVIALLDHVVGRPECFGEVYDVGGPDVLSYRALMELTAEVLGVQRRMLPVPVLTPRLSRLWVSTVTGAPAQLVAPLVESLAHPMLARDARLYASAGLTPTPIREALARAIALTAPERPRAYEASPDRVRRDVRSVQRLPLPPGRDAQWVAEEYLRWLPGGARPLVVERLEGHRCRFRLVGVPTPLLELTHVPERSSADRQLFFVTGGALAEAGGRGRLEFRTTPDGQSVIAAVHEFVPSLPWPIYRGSQALAHLAVMHAFGRHLGRAASAPGEPVPVAA